MLTYMGIFYWCIMPRKCKCDQNCCLLHDSCSCGSIKQVSSKFCRSCYTFKNKQCLCCNNILKYSEFPRNKESEDGLRSLCRDCCGKSCNRNRLKDKCRCGNNMRIDATQCILCVKELYEKNILENITPIKDYLYKDKKNPSYRSKIRNHARRVIEIFKVNTDVCTCCPFNFGLQVCHIKSIKDFDEDTPINVVNHPDNLVILCPNCHWLQDHGYPTIENIVDYLKQNNLPYNSI